MSPCRSFAKEPESKSEKKELGCRNNAWYPSYKRLMGGELEADDPAHDKAEADNPPRRQRLSEQNDTQNGRADRTDPGPDGITGSQRDRPNRQRKEGEADHHSSDGQHTRTELGEAVRVLQADGPGDFKEGCGEQIDPSHNAPLALVGGSSLPKCKNVESSRRLVN